jgi:hypothetical protein
LAETFAEMHPEIDLKKFGKGKNEGKIHTEMYDPIDAYIMCRAGFVLMSQ